MTRARRSVLRRLLPPLSMVGAVLVLAGCVAEPGADASRAPVPSASWTPAPVASELPATPADGVWATGTLASPAGGELRITGQNGSTSTGVVELSGLTGVRGGGELMLVPASATLERGCLGGPTLDVGPVSGASATGVMSLSDVDPTAWRRAVIVDRSAAACPVVLASADLAWRVAPFRPRLVSIADGGSARGATGQVSAVGGTVHSYAVARGDNLRAIANRFGIGESDLRYLNPFRSWDQNGSIFAGEVLNLSLDAR